jgi:hypothetical protein
MKSADRSKLVRGDAEEPNPMDERQFDALSRVLVALPSRRHLVRLAGVFALGGWFAGKGTDATTAKKGKGKKRKKKARRSPPAALVTPPPPPFCSGKPDDPETFCGTEFVAGDRSTWFFCSGGVCGLVPECGTKSTAEICDPGAPTHPQCCDQASCSNQTGRCDCSSIGTPCIETFDCCGSDVGFTRCVGFVCQRV